MVVRNSSSVFGSTNWTNGSSLPGAPVVAAAVRKRPLCCEFAELTMAETSATRARNNNIADENDMDNIFRGYVDLILRPGRQFIKKVGSLIVLLYQKGQWSIERLQIAGK